MSADGTASPVKAPSRKQRNAAPRQRDMQFVNDIGQGLLVECRRLQALIAEKEEKLKEIEISKSQLETVVKNLESHVRHGDEAEGIVHKLI